MPSTKPGAMPPRLYQLDPLLAGPIDAWGGHLERIRAMGFTGIDLASPFQAGENGALDAPADPRRLDSRLAAGGADGLDRLARFVDEVARAGLEVVLEAPLPVTAVDGTIAREHPDWLARDMHGGLVPLGNGVALSLDGHHDDQVATCAGLLGDYLATGVRGLRFSYAHAAPGDFWQALLERVGSAGAGKWFIADVLGAPAQRFRDYAGIGFTGALDNSRWWDFHDRWFVDQQPALAAIGVVFAFPEQAYAARLAAEYDGDDPAALGRLLEAGYRKALGLGAGVIMPMGFEFGCRRPLDARQGSAEDWTRETAAPAVDLRSFIKAANALKGRHPALGGPVAVRRVNSPNARAAALVRLAHASPAMAEEALFVCANPAVDQPDGLDPLGLIMAAGGRFERLVDVSAGGKGVPVDLTRPLTLAPGEIRLVASQAVKSRAARSRGNAADKQVLAKAPNRVAIEKVEPELDGGRFPIKRMVGEILAVEADIFMDGHEQLAARLLVRAADERDWSTVAMRPVVNDRWTGAVPLTRNTRYRYTIEAWHDVFGSWRLEISKKHAAGVPIALELEEGRALVARTAAAAAGAAKEALQGLLAELAAHAGDEGFQLARLLAAETQNWMDEADLRANLTRYERELEVVVDRTAAVFAAWYELFPRSMSDDPTRHGTFDDVIAKLPYVRDMGFDVLYFPPIHPIGHKNKKGRNNTLTPAPDDPGSPYAIGSPDGGHDAIHPELGTFEDFARLVEAAHEHGLELALDFAIQCSPDHPWLQTHPDWFDWRPDGSLKYAENPPKKYEDITNVDFYTEGALPGLWLALRDVVVFWVEHGVKIFRVDNPHTKPLPFWEWLITDVQAKHPDTVFLAEAFTRPKMMQRLAKVGFTQSYSYFTWRNTKYELQSYLTELTQDEPKEHMRPNFFVNTPDINPVYLQTSGRPGFRVRLVLAGTLSTLYGVYSGFELCEGTPIPGKEEYLDSEKYEIKAWDWHRPTHIRDDIRLLNKVRRENPAFWSFTNLEFMQAWNDNVMVYCKMTPARDNAVLVAVNLDPHNAQSCSFEVPLWHFGLEDHGSIGVEDLVTGARFTWTGKVQQVFLEPHQSPYRLWRLVPPGLAASSPFADRRRA